MGRRGWRRREAQEKRRKYIVNVAVHGMDKKHAALDAGFSPCMARHAGSLVETPEVCEAIESLEKVLLESVPTGLLARRFREGLDATIVKTAQQDGKIKDVKHFPDHRTRMESAMHIAVISGRYQPKTTTEHTGKDGGPIELMALTHEGIEQEEQLLEKELGISRAGCADEKALPGPAGEGEAGQSQ